MADRNNVYHFLPSDGGGEPPDMEQRLRHLETDMAVVKETMATGQQLSEMESRIIKWNVGTIITVAALVFAIIKLTSGS